MSGYRTPLKRARGLGAAGHGAGHWISERVSSIALVPLSLWAVFAALKLAPYDYDSAMEWVHRPLNAVLLVLLFAVSFLHMHSGLRVVVEDYIHKPFSKAALLILNLFVCGLGAGLAIVAILSLAFAGASTTAL
jgi:succinate dehydrogenase / fumarate reductase membrane anchor subunit